MFYLSEKHFVLLKLNLETSLSIQPVFHLFCLEESKIRQLKAFVKDGKVNTNKNMCGRKIVRMAYNHLDGYFELDKDMKVKNLNEPSKVLNSFFSSQNLTPVWKNANFDWGRFDEETGRWTGAVALVRLGSSYMCPYKHKYPQVAYDKADLGVDGFACSHARSTVVLCSQALYYRVYRWFSRAPRPLPPASNLVRIFTSSSWLAVFTSVIAVTILLLIVAMVGKTYGINTFNYVDLALVPYRSAKLKQILMI